MHVLNIHAACSVPAYSQLSNLGRFVGRIVEDLDFEQLARVVHLADRIDQPVGDVHLVEDRQLDRDGRQYGQLRQRLGHVPLVFHVKIHKVIAVPAVDGQDAEHEKIRDEDQRISQVHKKMNPSHGTTVHINAGLKSKSTLVSVTGR